MTHINALSNAKLKFYQSLREKKYRKRYGLFLAEGKKLISEGLNAGINFEAILTDENILSEATASIDFPQLLDQNILTCTETQIHKIATLEQPEGMIGIAFINDLKEDSWVEENPGIALYKIADPGNMGTILRTALWFGIRQVVCDMGTVELYNPKTVRATMGAVWKMNVIYVEELNHWLQDRKKYVVGADMKGTPIHDFKAWKRNNIFLFGNESNGLKGLETQNYDSVHIAGKQQIESLNVGVASGIILHEWMNAIK